jgi:hypothetical protein
MKTLLIPIVVLTLLAGCAGSSEPAAEAPSPSAPVSTAPPAESPSPTPTETASDEPVLTTVGFGDVKLGEKIPADSTIAAFDDTACSGGGAIEVLPEIGTEDDISIVTKDRTLDTEVIAIIFYTDAAATKSGVRVGDSLDTLKQTYGDELKSQPGGDALDYGLYQVSDSSGRVVFQLEDDVLTAIGAVPNGDDSVGFAGTDAFSPCGVA